MLCHVQAKDKRAIVKKKETGKKNQCSGIENRALYERTLKQCVQRNVFSNSLCSEVHLYLTMLWNTYSKAAH